MNNTMEQLLAEMILTSVFLFPVLLSFAFFIRRLRPLLCTLAPWSALPAIILSTLTQPGSYVDLNWLLLNTRFGMNATAQVFLFFTSMIWLASGIYAVSYLKEGRHTARFFISYLLAMSGNLGLIIAQDVVSFYCFFALMSFASYGLIVHSGTKAAHQAGRAYIILVVIGEIMVFSALTLAAHASESTYLSDLPAKIAVIPQRHFIIGLILLGFGIKAGALPLHVWLPLAHPVAPTPASAVLSACMIKAGLLGWLNFLPLGEITFKGWGITVVLFGLAAAFWGVIAGLTQKKPKTVLAYSSISQMGLITTIVGCALILPSIWPICWAAIMIYALHHAFVKGALFLGVSLAGTRHANNFHKIFIFGLLFLPTMAIAGTPLTSGFLAKNSLKYVLKKILYELQWSESALFILSLSAFGTTLLLARFFWTLQKEAPTKDSHSPVTLSMMLPWSVLAVSCLIIPYQPFILNLLPGKSSGGLTDILFDLKTIWPLLFGILTAFLTIKTRFRVPLNIPAGDILTVYTLGIHYAWSFIRKSHQQIIDISNKYGLSLTNFFTSKVSTLSLYWQKLDAGDRYLRNWKLFGVIFFILAFTFFIQLTLHGFAKTLP